MSPCGWDAYAEKIGFTGEKKDALGRRVCYDGGKRVACAKNQAPKAGKDQAAAQKPAGKPAATATPPTAPKPTVPGMAAALSSIKAAGPVSPLKTKQVAARLAQMSVKELGELKTHLGIKAGGARAVLAARIAEKALAHSSPASPSPTVRGETTSGQSVADFRHPAGFEPEAGNTPNAALPDASRPRLGGAQANAVRTYTGGAYEGLNAALRQGKEPPGGGEAAEVRKGLKAAFAQVAPFERPVKVYRGLDLPPDRAAAFVRNAVAAGRSGRVVSLPGYTSTTTDPVHVDDPDSGAFAGAVKLEIEATHGLDARPYSMTTREDELILDDGAQFEITGVRKDPATGRYVVKLRQKYPPSKAGAT